MVDSISSSYLKFSSSFLSLILRASVLILGHLVLVKGGQERLLSFLFSNSFPRDLSPLSVAKTSFSLSGVPIKYRSASLFLVLSSFKNQESLEIGLFFLSFLAPKGGLSFLSPQGYSKMLFQIILLIFIPPSSCYYFKVGVK